MFQFNMEQISLYHFLIFVLPGFMLMWSFRYCSKSNTKLSDFEYLAFSTFWGLVLLLINEWVMPKEKVIEILANPYTATFIFAITGLFFGYVGGFLKKELKEFIRYLQKWGQPPFILENAKLIKTVRLGPTRPPLQEMGSVTIKSERKTGF